MQPRASSVAVVAITAVLSAPASFADEGMWTFNHFPVEKVEKVYGFRPDQAWLDHVRLSTLRIPGHCSASFVSAHGLVLTNHHCVRHCIEVLSSAGRDIGATGFYAKQAGDELKCEGFELDQTLAITEVTERLSAATAGKDGQDYAAALDAERASITKECAGNEAGIRCEVVELHGGAVYDLYRNRVYDDVRLVFAPEGGIANFGGDIDDFHFPHTSFDVAFVRVYADGKPLDTAANYLRQSAELLQPGQLTFAPGSPGFTFRTDTLARLEFRRDIELPHHIFDDLELRGMLVEYSAINTEHSRAAANALATVESRVKYNKGRFDALTGTAVIRLRAQAEQDLRQRIAEAAQLKAQYGDIWDKVRDLLNDFQKRYDRYNYTVGGYGFRSDLFDLALGLVHKAQSDRPTSELQSAEQSVRVAPRKPGRNAKAINQRTTLKSAEQPAGDKKDRKSSNSRSAVKSSATPATYDAELEKLNLAFSLTQLRAALGPDDALVKKVLGREAPEQRAAALIDSTGLNNAESAEALAKGGADAVEKSNDPMIVFARQLDGDLRAIEQAFARDVEQPLTQYLDFVARATFEVYHHAVYPDASYSLRLSYGSIAGYAVGDERISPITQIGTLFDRATDADPYKLPAAWLAAKAGLNMTESLNFISTNDVIGGNSGSPTINQNGELVGVLFDVNYPALGGYFANDAAVNRAIGVSAGAMREALAKVYHANRLVTELAE